MMPSNESSTASLTPSSTTVIPKHLFNNCICTHTKCSFPYFNHIWCPQKLWAWQVKQYDVLKLLDKRGICTRRYVVEVPFSRLLSMLGLRDTVPYKNLWLVPYMLEWGHTEMNLGMPLRKPGSDSGLPPCYWGDSWNFLWLEGPTVLCVWHDTGTKVSVITKATVTS
jgi:hypothetical protein